MWADATGRDIVAASVCVEWVLRDGCAGEKIVVRAYLDRSAGLCGCDRGVGVLWEDIAGTMQSKVGRPDFQSLLEGQQDLICRFHKHELQPHQCGSILLQQIKAPVGTVWAFARRFDKPQVYKSLIHTCDIIDGDGGVGSIREIHLVSSIPATSSIERLEILDHEQHIISFKVLTGGHRLQNYWSVTSLHEHEIDGQMGTLVLESYVVDIPECNTREETHMFVDTVVRCNLKKLARLSEHQHFHEQHHHKSEDVPCFALDSHSGSVLAVEG